MQGVSETISYRIEQDEFLTLCATAGIKELPDFYDILETKPPTEAWEDSRIKNAIAGLQLKGFIHQESSSIIMDSAASYVLDIFSQMDASAYIGIFEKGEPALRVAYHFSGARAASIERALNAPRILLLTPFENPEAALQDMIHRLELTPSNRENNQYLIENEAFPDRLGVAPGKYKSLLQVRSDSLTGVAVQEVLILEKDGFSSAIPPDNTGKDAPISAETLDPETLYETARNFFTDHVSGLKNREAGSWIE